MAISNGGFESGDLTDWVNDSEGTGAATVQSVTKRTGTYALKLESSTAGGLAGIHRTLVTALDTFKCYVSVTACSGENSYFRIYIWDFDSAEAINWDIESTTSGFELQEIDISSQLKRDTDGIYLAILADAPSNPGTITAYVDDCDFAGTLSMEGTSETGTEGVGSLEDVNIELAGTSETGTEGLGAPHIYINLDGTSETGTAGAGIIKNFLTFGNYTVPFDAGEDAFAIGETVTGGTTGASGVVVGVIVTSGSWAGDDAAGTLIISGVVGDFIEDEDLEGSIAGVATSDGEITALGPKIVKYNVSKGIDNIYAVATVTCSGIYGVSDVADYNEIEVLLPNYLTGVRDEQVFLGVVPDFAVKHNAADKTTTLTGFGHMWYLANRQMPDNYLTNVSWDASDEILEYAEPSVGVTTLFGGANWNTLCGINPQHIVPVGDWGFPTPIKGWKWDKSVKRWDAIREMCEYLDYFCETALDGTLTPKGVFAPLEDADDYVPAAVTFDVDDDPEYVISVNKKAPGSQKPSLVTVTGARNYRILKFTGGVNEFAADNKLDLIDLATFTSGSNIVTTYGYLSSKLNVGDLIYDSTNDTYEDAVAIASINLDTITLESNYGGDGGTGWNNLSKLTEGYGTLLDGGTGAEAFIVSFEVTDGSWAGDDAEGTVIIMPDRTGSFVAGNTIIDTRGAAYGSATAASNDEFYELYDYYSYSYPTTEPPRAVEHFENCPEDIDSGPLIEDYAEALYTFLQLDNNEYTLVLNKRSDLRLWQKVKVTGYTEVPEEWMRIVHINYEYEAAKVIVTCTLKNSEYVLSAAKLKRTARYSDEQALETMVDKILDKKIKVEDAEIIAVDGEGYTAEIINGQVVVRAKGTE